MTADEAIARAKIIAGDQRWPWREPAFAAWRRRGLLGLFEPYWEVISNARANRENVRVAFVERTGQMFRSAFTPADTGGPPITEFQAVEIALEVAEKNRWMWKQPIQVTPRKYQGVRSWWVRSNANCRGMNVSVLVNPDTGVVLAAGFSPR